MSSPDLPTSKLGTKKHWDDVYSTELSNFQEIGDEGEIWFGEDSVEKMTDWAVENMPPDTSPMILEVGSGNGTLLFALHEAGYTPANICGVDYSEDAVRLAQGISESRGEGATDIAFSVCDFLRAYPSPLGSSPNPSDRVGFWDLVLDKGTFDAMALSERDESGNAPWDAYPPRIAHILKPGGYFLITSCNFTEEELRTQFSNAETGLEYQWVSLPFKSWVGN